MTKFSLARKWVIMKKQRRILFSLVLMLFLLACSTASTETGNVLRGKVVRVADGDTVTILVDETQHRIRLDGIDCPELKQAFGRKAKDFVSDLVFGETVKVVYEDTDFYGRILGVVYAPGGVNVNEELLKAGLAWHYKQYNKSEKLARLEDAARAAKKGLWADKNPMPPWEFRKSKKKK